VGLVDIEGDWASAARRSPIAPKRTATVRNAAGRSMPLAERRPSNSAVTEIRKELTNSVGRAEAG
jgi:hypothetical protein